MFDYLLTSVIFICIDLVYLSSMKGYFENQVKKIQGSNIKLNIFGSLLCYLLLILGINYFIIQQKKSVMDAFLLGILIYGVYETTNYALLHDWSFTTVLLDTLWGGILFAITTALVYKIKSMYSNT
jgi:uncharacterized membrane protein